MIDCEKNPSDKYLKTLQTGDVLFMEGKRGALLDYIIRLLTRSRFVHVAILVELNHLWFVVEAKCGSKYGYQMSPLNWWLARHQDDSIYLGKMPNSNAKITSNIRNILLSSGESLRPYKVSWIFFTFILQVLMGIFRPNINKLYKNLKPIACSTLIQEAWERAGAIEQSNYMTPGCLVKFLGGEAALTSLVKNSSQKDHLNYLEKLDPAISLS